MRTAYLALSGARMILLTTRLLFNASRHHAHKMGLDYGCRSMRRNRLYPGS